MPRRLITSEIWTNEKFGNLDLVSRLVFIGLITHADDDGRLKGSPKFLRIKIFPYDDNIKPDDIQQAIENCHNNHLIIAYNINGNQFIQLTGWSEHQSIRKDRYQESTIPSPPDNQPSTNGIPVNTQKATNRQPLDNHLTTTGMLNISKDNISKDNIIKGDKQSLSSLENLEHYNKELKKYPASFIPLRKQVFAGLNKRRGFASRSLGAEAKAISQMLEEEFNPEQILRAYDLMLEQPFYKDKHLSMMAVRKNVHEVLRNDKPVKSQGVKVER